MLDTIRKFIIVTEEPHGREEHEVLVHLEHHDAAGVLHPNGEAELIITGATAFNDEGNPAGRTTHTFNIGNIVSIATVKVIKPAEVT